MPFKFGVYYLFSTQIKMTKQPSRYYLMVDKNDSQEYEYLIKKITLRVPTYYITEPLYKSIKEVQASGRLAVQTVTLPSWETFSVPSNSSCYPFPNINFSKTPQRMLLFFTTPKVKY